MTPLLLKSLAILTITGSLISTVSSKIVEGQIQLDGELPEAYISKFSLNGNGSITGTVATADGKPFQTGGVALFIFNAKDWPAYHKATTCMERARLASSRFAIGGTTGKEITSEEALQATYNIREFKPEFGFNRVLSPEVDGEVLYMVLTDCSLEQIYHKLPLIDYNIKIMNGESHIPAEEYGLFTAYLSIMVLLLGFGALGTNLVTSQQSTLGSIPLITKMLLLSYVFYYISTFLEMAHLFMYSIDGKGMWICDIVAELMLACVSTVVNFILLALACGWTLTDSSTGSSFIVALRDPSKLFKWVDVGGMQLPAIAAVPSALVVIIFTVLFVVVEAVDVFTSSREHDFMKTHDHDSLAGRILMLMQVLFCALFFYSINGTRKVVNVRQQDFLFKLLVAGGVWFLITPFLVTMSPMFSLVTRHRIITTGSIVLQSTALLLMCRLFLTRSSEYYKLSSMATMGTIMGMSPNKPVGSSKSTD